MAQIVVAQRMWQRRDTAANWTSANPVLAAGEIGVELGATTGDPQKFKIGNGSTPWNSLAYFEGGAAGGGIAVVVIDSSTSYNVESADVGSYRVMTSTSAKTVTVRPQSSHALSDNYEQHFDNKASGDLTFAAGSGVTIHAPLDGSFQVPPGGVVTLKRLGLDEFRLVGVTAPSAPAFRYEFPVITDSSTSYDVSAGDYDAYRLMSSASGKTVTVRPQSTHALPDSYQQHFDNTGAGLLTFVAGSGVTILPNAGGTLKVATDGVVTLKRLAADVFRLVGQTVAA